MNNSKLKSYAPQARKDFIAAVAARANQLGLSEQGDKLEVAPAEQGGDVVIIAGQPWPAKVQGQREQLIKRIQKDGFAQTMEAVATLGSTASPPCVSWRFTTISAMATGRSPAAKAACRKSSPTQPSCPRAASCRA